MIEETLYKIESQGYCFGVIANSYGEAETIAKEAIKSNKRLQGSTDIYRIYKDGYVYRPKTKTVTIDV